MSTVSQDLIWGIVKNRHNKIYNTKLSGNVVLSKEYNNLYNLNTQKFSGYGNEKAVAVHIAPATKKVKKQKKDVNALVLRTKRASQRVPRQRDYNIKIKKAGYSRRAENIASRLKSFRPDLVQSALKRLVREEQVAQKAKATKKTETKKQQ